MIIYYHQIIIYYLNRQSENTIEISGSNWSDWGPFTECCGHEQTRERNCKYDHKYKNVRIKCYGRTTDVQKCVKESTETCIGN